MMTLCLHLRCNYNSTHSLREEIYDIIFIVGFSQLYKHNFEVASPLNLERTISTQEKKVVCYMYVCIVKYHKFIL